MSTGDALRVIVATPQPQPERARLLRRARLLAWGGIAWHVVEFAVAIGAGIAAGSIALIGFGADSLIEAAAGSSWSGCSPAPRRLGRSAERRAQQLIAASFFVLAAYVGVEARARSLVAGDHPAELGRHRARRGHRADDAAAGAREGAGGPRARVAGGRERGRARRMLCAYLSVALLVGLGANALLGWWWADPVTALAIAAVALREGVEKLAGRSRRVLRARPRCERARARRLRRL